jgi:hypothetical protein
MENNRLKIEIMDMFILVGQSVVGAFEQEEWEYLKTLKDDDGCIIIWDSVTEHVYLVDIQGYDSFALTQEDGFN